MVSVDFKLNIIIVLVVVLLVLAIYYHIAAKPAAKAEKYDFTQGDLDPELGAISTWDTVWSDRWAQVLASPQPDVAAARILNQQVKPCKCPKCKRA